MQRQLGGKSGLLSSMFMAWILGDERCTKDVSE
jgi:hypothetical protein